MRKIAIFSDIHGNYEALKAILKDISKEYVHEIICLGDTIGIGPEGSKCLALLKRNHVKMVLGNHELYYLEGTRIDNAISDEEKKHHDWVASTLNEKDKNYLEKCELEYVIKYKDKEICFTHFLPNQIKSDYPFAPLNILQYNENWYFKPNKYEMIFIGHEHKSYHPNNIVQNIKIIGSAGCTKDEHTSYVMLTIDKKGLTCNRIYLKYDRETFERKVKETDYPERKTLSKIFFGIEKL